eukprot:2645719-Ditylum_brightwellii.AAC.1
MNLKRHGGKKSIFGVEFSIILLIARIISVYCLSSNDSMQRPSQYYNDFVKNLPSLEGKTIVITGCSRGLGHVTAMTVVKKGGRAILLNRKASSKSPEWYHQLQNEATGPKPINIECDLLSFESVRQACQRVREETQDTGIDVLCCNAGIMLQPNKASVDGYDVTASTNMLSHFLLTKELFGQLEHASKNNGLARIVIMSSASGYGGPALDPTFFQRRGGNLGESTHASYARYHQTKLANLAFCSALKDRLE